MEGNAIFQELFKMSMAMTGIMVLVFGNAILMAYFERKWSAHMHRRLGPMEVGPHGILQSIIDGVKLLGKQLIVPRDADRTLYRLAPILSMAPVVLAFIVFPFAPKLQAVDLEIALVFVLSMASLNVLAILIGGWGSNNKYGLFGAIRSVAQNVAYEVPMLLALLAVILVSNTLSFEGMVRAQQDLIWFVFLQPVAFLIYIVSGIAETNRAPFDLPEAESELTAGFHTEYSGMGFALFFLAEYTNMLIVASVAAFAFLGGYAGFPLPFFEYSGVIWYLAKVYLLMFFMVWVRFTYPRTRFDQLMNFSWTYLIPFALVNLLITAVVVKL